MFSRSCIRSSFVPRTLFRYHSNVPYTEEPPRIMVTGSCGQVGLGLVKSLRKIYGDENVLGTDIVRPHCPTEHFAYLNVLDKRQVDRLIVEHRISWIVHNSALLSASAERNFDAAFEVNFVGAKNLLESAKNYNLRIFSPSSIAAFGVDTPLDNVPDVTVQRPSTIYGISKVFLELLGDYYHQKFGVDFRSLRYPGIISNTLPGGGTTDYAVEIFFEAIKTGKYECFLSEDTALPMMYMPDCIKATVNVLQAPAETLKQRTYNIAGFTVTPKQLENELRKHIPNLEVTYKTGDFRQKIADSWPKKLDDSRARADWNWKEDYDLTAMTADMVKEVRKTLGDAAKF